MNITVYIIISVCLFIIIFIYYYLQKSKNKLNIVDTYSRYLLREPNPVSAFTYKQLSNNQYENYYLNYNPEINDIIVKEVNDYPVDGDGVQYITTEHGTVTENDKGFTISGCDTVFECPENWYWDVDSKTCKLKDICNEQTALIKGLDLYYFNLTEKSTKYHDRLYVLCKNDTVDYDIKECPLNSLYNQLSEQPANADPCVKYDICQDLREYTIHKVDIGNGIELKDNEYYICINSKSEIKECETNAVFNTSYNGCVKLNQCAFEDNGFTIPIDSNSYTLCNNGNEFIVNCQNSVYEGNGSDKLECVIDKSETFKDYFVNDYILIPINLYIYQNNVRSIYNATSGFTIRTMILLPSENENNFFTVSRNLTLYPTTQFPKYYVDYVDDITKEEGQSIELNSTTYPTFATKTTTQVSYFKNALIEFEWSVFEDKPIFQDVSEIYYRYNTVIKSITDDTLSLPAVDYFYFTSAAVIYQPKEVFIMEISSDKNTGILQYVDFKIPIGFVVTNLIFTLALKVLAYDIMSDERYIFYFVDPFSKSLNAIVWSTNVIEVSSFKDNSVSFITSTLFNYEPINIINNRLFYIRLSSISWYGNTKTTENYVIPELLSPIIFTKYKQLNKQFQILRSETLSNNTSLDEFREQVKTSYVDNQTLTGDYTYLLDIQYKINNQLLTTTT
ncbi:Vp91 [Aratus pisonii nudivirus]|nr:Vp91 [Aratus pisonii nudivirus]